MISSFFNTIFYPSAFIHKKNDQTNNITYDDKINITGKKAEVCTVYIKCIDAYNLKHEIEKIIKLIIIEKSLDKIDEYKTIKNIPIRIFFSTKLKDLAGYIIKINIKTKMVKIVYKINNKNIQDEINISEICIIDDGIVCYLTK